MHYAAQHVWDWFFELDAGRQAGMGHNALSWSDIRSWQDLTGNKLKLWELTAIRAMDRVRLEWLAKPEKEGAPASGLAAELSSRSKTKK